MSFSMGSYGDRSRSVSTLDQLDTPSVLGIDHRDGETRVMTQSDFVAWAAKFTDELQRKMTMEQAAAIRERRQDATWRGVARFCHERYRQDWDLETWTGRMGPEHQLVGERICVVAAILLGKDPDAEPWN
jgi:hypothetical protein